MSWPGRWSKCLDKLLSLVQEAQSFHIARNLWRSTIFLPRRTRWMLNYDKSWFIRSGIILSSILRIIFIVCSARLKVKIYSRVSILSPCQIVYGQAHRVRPYPSQMREETLIQCQWTLGLDCLEQTVKRATVQRASLVVHPAHNRIWWMHYTANYKARYCTRSQVDCRWFGKTKFFRKSSLGKKVCGKLNARSKSCANHSWTNTTVETSDAFVPVYTRQTIPCVLVLMLRADW